ncbi:ABC-F family ATP-binding cassette domain-containing protein [Mycolicibacterium lutetiense]
MAHLDLSRISYGLPDGRPLLHNVSLRVGAGERVALIGANGAGKSTLLKIVLGEIEPDEGSISRSGGVGVMRQFIEGDSVRDLLLSVAPPPVVEAARRVDCAEHNMLEAATEASQMKYANALTAWGEVGGYEFEVFWDVCTEVALGIPYDQAASRPVETLSGGEQKRLVLEALLRGTDGLLILDEPDNFLDVPGKRWLEDRLREAEKSVLFVSHDRELLARSATAVVTLELGAAGSTAWTHPGSFETYHAAREARFERLDELRRRWDEEHAKLKALVLMYKQKAANNDGMASRYQAAQTRLQRFETAGPPHELPREQRFQMRLAGGRTGKRAVVCDQLELIGLMFPFDAEAWYGDRIAVLGANGSGKSHFLRLLAAGGTDPEPEHEPSGDLLIEPVEFEGRARLGARVRPGWFAQTQRRPDLAGRTLLEVLHHGDGRREGRDRESATRALARYELAHAAEQVFDSLSGGQQARFQILLLELGGATLLLLDEPTDHLDLESAEALQQAIAAFEGTVIAVTHDRWFARDFDRFWIFQEDGEVVESSVPVWDEGRVVRPR